MFSLVRSTMLNSCLVLLALQQYKRLRTGLRDLAVYFTRKVPPSTRTATRAISTATAASSPNDTSKTNVGAISGGEQLRQSSHRTTLCHQRMTRCYTDRHKTCYSTESCQGPMQQSLPESPPLPPDQQPQRYFPPPQQGQPYLPPPPQPQVGDSRTR